jgi:transcriptional regulator with XRE-family HTH domain
MGGRPRAPEAPEDIVAGPSGGAERAAAATALDQHLGARLRALRSGRGMNEEQAAAALHVPVAVLRGIEAGEGRLSALRLLQFAGLLGAPLTALFAAPSPETAQSALGQVRSLAALEPVRPDQRELLDFLRAWLAIEDESKRGRMAEALVIAAEPE